MNYASVALVTGGGGGLGQAIGRRLAARGKSVVLIDINRGAVEAAAELLRAEGGAVTATVADVTNKDEVARVVAEFESRLGPIDILVNNAGFPRDAPLVNMTDEDFRSVVDVCLFGAFVCSRAVVPQMIERKYGKIVNIASRAYLGNPGQANYSAAKAGIVGMTKSLAKELGKHSITVNAVAPGIIDTPAVKNHPRYDLLVELANKENSIRRLGKPDDVAAAVDFLSSDDSSFITGDVLHVSGGRYS
ncbi:3-oxoacyl-ACP reductase [Microbacterium sp. CH12i]|uniref:SDR family NAD(P)-dependent oxidoreductase n=1 Tax=Microbacterium sp. CH12i TaxID=1479651 RepID=UPI000461705F|nr:SDR family NAD(P)-dependent oxidoreductase [Microbacterium sp. CH12i]KDA07155.1 3-oxoacyl-ACP reductase [Microbacterium sp. CH12i]